MNPMVIRTARSSPHIPRGGTPPHDPTHHEPENRSVGASDRHPGAARHVVRADLPGSEITIAMGELPTSLDPPRDWAIAATWIHMNIFDCLVWRDRETMEFVPWLATSWENIDDHTWRLKLREDVTFHNGEDVQRGSGGVDLQAHHDGFARPVHHLQPVDVHRRRSTSSVRTRWRS